MLKESLEHQQHVRFSSKTAETRDHDTFSLHRSLNDNSLKLNHTKLNLVVIHSSKEALHQSPNTYRSEQTSLDLHHRWNYGPSSYNMDRRVFKYVNNGARDLVSHPFTSTIYGMGGFEFALNWNIKRSRPLELIPEALRK